MKKSAFFCILVCFLSFCSCTRVGQSVMADEQAYVYYREGKLLQQQFYLLSAIDRFQAAERLAGNDSALLCRVNIELCRIGRLLMQPDDEAQSLEKAFRAAVAADNDTLLAVVFHEKGLAGLERKAVAEGLQAMRKSVCCWDDKAHQAACRADMARLYLLAGKTDSALHCVNQAVAGLAPARIPVAWRLLKSDIFLSMQATDSARFYLSHGIDSLSLAEHVEVVRGMARADGLDGDKTGELKRLKEYAVLRESLAVDRKEEIMEKIHMAQEYRQQRDRAEQAERERMEKEVMFHRTLWGALACILGLLGLHYCGWRNKQKLIVRLQQEKLRNMETEIALAREQQTREQKEIELLNRTVDYYRRLNVITLPMLMSKRNSQDMLHLSSEEWDMVVGNTDACFDRFTERLKARCPQLTKEDLCFCCLVKMELPLSLLADIYHIAKGSISRRKMRLKEKLQVADTSFDEFIRNF